MNKYIHIVTTIGMFCALISVGLQMKINSNLNKQIKLKDSRIAVLKQTIENQDEILRVYERELNIHFTKMKPK